MKINIVLVIIFVLFTTKIMSNKNFSFMVKKESKSEKLKFSFLSNSNSNYKSTSSLSLFRIDDSPVSNLHGKFNKYEHDHNNVEINEHFDVNDKLKVFNNRNKDHNDKLSVNYNNSTPPNYKTVIRSKKRIDDKNLKVLSNNGSYKSSNIEINSDQNSNIDYTKTTKVVINPDENEYKIKLNKNKRHFTCNENQLGSCANHCIQYLGIYSCIKEVVVIDQKSSEEINLPVLCICRKHFQSFTIENIENLNNN